MTAPAPTRRRRVPPHKIMDNWMGQIERKVRNLLLDNKNFASGHYAREHPATAGFIRGPLKDIAEHILEVVVQTREAAVDISTYTPNELDILDIVEKSGLTAAEIARYALLKEEKAASADDDGIIAALRTEAVGESWDPIPADFRPRLHEILDLIHELKATIAALNTLARPDTETDKIYGRADLGDEFKIERDMSKWAEQMSLQSILEARDDGWKVEVSLPSPPFDWNLIKVTLDEEELMAWFGKHRPDMLTAIAEIDRVGGFDASIEDYSRISDALEDAELQRLEAQNQSPEAPSL